MSVPETAAQDWHLDAVYGVDRKTGGPNPPPDSYDLELWDGDPRNTGSAELTSAGGYASQSVDADDFGPASGGQTLGPIVGGTATAEFSDTATHYVLRHPTSGVMAFCAPLGEPLDVTGAGDWSVRPIVYFADAD